MNHDIKHTTSRQAIIVWLFLVLATLCSAWAAEHNAFAGKWTALLVMGVAALKGRAVIMHFMEMKAAPFAWRAAFEIWAWLCPGLIIVLWAVSGEGGF